jgi:hypothetical protein
MRAFGFKRAYTDHRKMLEQADDTVFVVMHPQLQPALAIEVMDSGRNVYIESRQNARRSARHVGRPKRTDASARSVS